MPLPTSFPYRVRWRAFVLLLGVAGGGTVILTRDALHATGGASIVSWLMAGVLLSITAVILGFFVRRFAFPPPMLELQHDRLVLPSGFLHRKRTTILYADLREVFEEKFQGRTALIVHGTTDAGRINAALLPNNQAYQVVKAFLYDQAVIATGGKG